MLRPTALLNDENLGARSGPAQGAPPVAVSISRWWPQRDGPTGESEGDRNRLISESDGQRRTWKIGALSSPLLTVPWSVVENEQRRMVGSETTRPRHESNGDCDAEVRVIAGTGMDASGSTASHATIN